ncbi:beta-glucosidase family protein [Parvularcula oceani]|uniref:beta-glucosidase family protein n=1 Tax=Parvularcula oceani TaxID=1247963 RepID=UPI00068F4E7B|nr:glycoside hydrolase family 3 C-terminal domain-containing protein [Parvularcula oceani]
MMTPKALALATSIAAMCAAAPLHAAQAQADPAARAAEVEAQMTDEERTQLTLGYMAMSFGGIEPPEGAIPGAGIVPGVPRLGVPALRETDASHGVTWVGGARGDGATALPAGIAQGATFNPELIERGGALIGSEARLKGFNVLLAGGINLMREARNGRTFEYMGEDPWHSGLMGAAAVKGIQSQNVISTLKHFAINPQETGRHFMNVEIDEPSLRESDLLAFEIAIERAQPGALMCAYNRINGPLSCGSEFLLTDVLRDDWGYKGFVMSDWGAVEALDFALAGLDQQSGAQLDEGMFFGEPLLEAAQGDPAYAERLGEMARNVLYAIYDVGIGEDVPERTDAENEEGDAVALATAKEAIVLLKNESGALPLAGDARKIAVIGGFADAGVPTGGGSSRVMPDEGPKAQVPILRGEASDYAFFLDRMYQGVAPLDAIRERAGEAQVVFRDGRYPSEAAMAAEGADVAIVFATQYQTEGYDVPDLSLPGNQDALIAAVAEANPNTIVVLETGGPVVMPWLDAVPAVLEAWYSGEQGGEAIASVLFGETNPSGHLPVSFPASTEQLPRPDLPGIDEIEPSFLGRGEPGQTLDADYGIEGSDIGYRGYAKSGDAPLFPFGHGLSYTEFEMDRLRLRGAGPALSARFRLRNTGETAGADVAQLYLVSAGGETKQRLVGFAKRQLAPGKSARVELEIEPRLLAEWEDDRWVVEGGEYAFALGHDAGTLMEPVSVKIDRFTIAADGETVGQ